MHANAESLLQIDAEAEKVAERQAAERGAKEACSAKQHEIRDKIAENEAVQLAGEESAERLKVRIMRHLSA